MSLPCKLVPGQYRGYEYGLFRIRITKEAGISRVGLYKVLPESSTRLIPAASFVIRILVGTSYIYRSLY